MRAISSAGMIGGRSAASAAAAASPAPPAPTGGALFVPDVFVRPSCEKLLRFDEWPAPEYPSRRAFCTRVLARTCPLPVTPWTAAAPRLDFTVRRKVVRRL